ncbi:MAG: FAD-dependent oxidoreductase [Candidatus Brocadiia bacterium]|nr:FAD-dependent oxidoreductase [Candidatus Brocadiia bacterium]
MTARDMTLKEMMVETRPFESCFRQTFDVIVFGAGYPAFGAALQAESDGKSVCLVNRQADLLWESGRAFAPHGGASEHPLWRQWADALKSRNAATDDEIDGALAEVIATDCIAVRDIHTLYYSTPVAAETQGGLLESVVVATKSGYRRLSARQWVDATETGEVLGLLSDTLPLKTPVQRTLFAYYQKLGWSDTRAVQLSLEDGIDLELQPSLWPRQRRLVARFPGIVTRPRRQLIPALQALFDAHPDLMADAVMSHCSLIDYPEYGPAEVATTTPTNLALASPALSVRGVSTLADRFALGAESASHLDDISVAHPPADIHTRSIADLPVRDERETGVLVAGAGTGGACAAIAAARAGAETLVIDPYEFPGGIGAGGGIHWYYYGVPGGLQAEVDQRTLDVMPLFGGRRGVRGFHPEARKLVLETMFDESGVTFVRGALVCDTHREGGTVTAVTVATFQGLQRIAAGAFIDATGDGDLCAQAGADFSMGRQGDGLVHAYSQSAGRIDVRDGQLGVDHMNYDAGWTDPTDAEDLTRARIAGIRHYLRDTYSDDARWTYIAPAIGLRQARQIATDYTVTLADLVEGRRFEDAIGYTGAHYDNHAVDYEFESDEGFFWVWVCRQWQAGRTACEMPYRMMLPVGLDNVWIACRAAGVTQDAHHSLRMQRDLQRLGEAAGNAAALSVRHQCGARGVPFRELRDRLVSTGALDVSRTDLTLDFGPNAGSEALKRLRAEDGITQEQIDRGMADLRSGTPSEAIWYLYRAGDAARDAVAAELENDNPMASWLAASVLGLWGDARGERRLLNAVRMQEYGFDGEEGVRKTPETNNRLVPNWMAAISLLRCCGTQDTLPVLRDMVHLGGHALNVRTSIGLTLERLVDRGVLGSAEKDAVEQMLSALSEGDIPGAFEMPQRNITQVPEGGAPRQRAGPPGSTGLDYRWQLALVLSRICRKLGLPIPDEAARYRNDERALVRRAFRQIDSASR